MERKLPKLRKKGSVETINFADIDWLPSAGEALYTSSELDLSVLPTKLKLYGLKKYEVELIIAKFIEEKTLDEIVTAQNWTSKGSCVWHLKKTLRKLKEMGFKL